MNNDTGQQRGAMKWVKLSTGILTDPDVVGLSADAFRTYINGIAYCGDNLTDGIITPKGLRVIRADAVDELVETGLWSLCDDGYIVRNYLAHQQSREQVLAVRAKAKARAEQRRSGDVRANTSRTSSSVRANTSRTSLSVRTNEQRSSFAEEEEEEETETTPSPAGDGGDPSGFAEWWGLYPRKVGKEAARKRYAAARKTASAEAITAGLDRAIAHWAAAGTAPQFIPHPATWLSQGRWEDQLEPVDPPAPKPLQPWQQPAPRLPEWVPPSEPGWGGDQAVPDRISDLRAAIGRAIKPVDEVV